MSSMGVQRSVSTPQLLNQGTQIKPTQRQTQVEAPKQTGQSGRLQQQVSSSRQQTQQQSQLSSPQQLRQVHGQIDQTPTQTLINNSKKCLQSVSDSQFAKKLVSGTKLGVETGAKLHDLSGDIPKTEELGEVLDSLTEKFELGENKISTVEAQLFEKLTGISTESMSSLKDVLATGQQVLQLAKTAQCLNEACQSYGTPEFSGKIESLAKNSYISLGGQSSLDLSEKVSSFCQSHDVDSGKEMLSALAKFSTDDSLMATTQRSLLSYMSSGSQVGGLVGKSVPFLSFGSALVDTGMAAKTGYDWWNGKATGTELCKSGVTVVGSVLGSTVAPVIGPLLATGVNLGISNAGSMYTSVSNWWSGTTT